MTLRLGLSIHWKTKGKAGSLGRKTEARLEVVCLRSPLEIRIAMLGRQLDMHV